jgi:hypothetical protein
MDGGSGINVLYASTLDEMGIRRSALRPSTAPFHWVIPGIEALPLGQIDLPVTFGDVRNFRTEPHLRSGGVLGDVPCDPREAGIREVYGRAQLYVPESEDSRTEGDHHSRAAVPNYTYLNLKITGPKGIITVGPTYQSAYECDTECF